MFLLPFPGKKSPSDGKDRSGIKTFSNIPDYLTRSGKSFETNRFLTKYTGTVSTNLCLASPAQRIWINWILFRNPSLRLSTPIIRSINRRRKKYCTPKRKLTKASISVMLVNALVWRKIFQCWSDNAPNPLHWSLYRSLFRMMAVASKNEKTIWCSLNKL